MNQPVAAFVQPFFIVGKRRLFEFAQRYVKPGEIALAAREGGDGFGAVPVTQFHRPMHRADLFEQFRDGETVAGIDAHHFLRAFDQRA